MVEFIFEGLDIVVAETENKIDDGLYMALKPMMQEAIEKLVDKIELVCKLDTVAGLCP